MFSQQRDVLEKHWLSSNKESKNINKNCTNKAREDRLNLKSKLCQYVSMAKIFSDGTIAELEIIAYEPEDIKKLVNFMMEN